MKKNSDGLYLVSPPHLFITSQQMFLENAYLYEHADGVVRIRKSPKGEVFTTLSVKNYLLEEANLKIMHANIFSDSINITPKEKLNLVSLLCFELAGYYDAQRCLWLTDLINISRDGARSWNESSYLSISRDENFVYCRDCVGGFAGAYKDFCEFKANEELSSEVALKAFKAVVEAEELLKGNLDSESELLTNLRNAEQKLTLDRFEYFNNCFYNVHKNLNFISIVLPNNTT